MGLFKSLLRLMGLGNKEVKVLTVGLDNSGKSTILAQLKPKKATTEQIVPTVGFKVESFSKQNLAFTVFDMSGAGRYRNLWEKYYADAQAVVFVIDCSDKLRMCVVREEMQALLEHPEMAGKPILFFANKMDISGVMTPVEVGEILQLDAVKDRPWTITASNGRTGEGLSDGVAWLAEHLSRK